MSGFYNDAFDSFDDFQCEDMHGDDFREEERLLDTGDCDLDGEEEGDSDYWNDIAQQGEADQNALDSVYGADDDGCVDIDREYENDSGD